MPPGFGVAGGSEKGPKSLMDESSMRVTALESRVGAWLIESDDEVVDTDLDDVLASDLAPTSIFLSPLPNFTTWARPCVAVLALLTKVEPTLKALAPLLGRPLPNFSKSILGTGGVFPPLTCPDLTLTTVGLARMPVCAGVWTWACLPYIVDAMLDRGAYEVRSVKAEMPE